VYVHCKPDADGTQFPTRMVEQTPTGLARKRWTCRRFAVSAITNDRVTETAFQDTLVPGTRMLLGCSYHGVASGDSRLGSAWFTEQATLMSLELLSLMILKHLGQ
jgi:hypothetical protein